MRNARTLRLWNSESSTLILILVHVTMTLKVWRGLKVRSHCARQRALRAWSCVNLVRVTPRNARYAAYRPYRALTHNYAKISLTRVLGYMQIRLRWRVERRKYKMSDSEEDVMLIGLNCK